ncbi:MAG: carboxypeptidase-like regulatory domain-containing protein [Chloroflexi bacterium]|nr:carboxypeptidase-like regulatory domain-containing protein [Chloroflexota bacterium]MCY3937819.1 carboxypeptidase-like regulatory domain-containing protein [Chloroflexota bacterium]
MRTRIVVIVSAALAVLILIPVVAVVGLGAYGSSLGGSTTSVGTRGAELKLIPAHGLPGSIVRIEGRNWPARAQISLSLSRPSSVEGAVPLEMRLARLQASRNGTFRLETIIPAALVNPDTRGFLITSQAWDRNDAPISNVSAGFEIEPYPNSVIVQIVDAESGAPLADSVLTISDSFDRVVTNGTTGSDGSAVFPSLAPGPLKVKVQRLGYREAKGELTVRDEGESRHQVSLAPAPIRRLYVPAAMSVDGVTAKFVGIDRWTGLTFEHEVPIPPNRNLPMISEDGQVYFGYLLPVGNDGSAAAEIDTPPQFFALGRALRSASYDVEGYPSTVSVRYVGEIDRGHVIASYAISGLVSFLSRILIVDPQSNEIVLNRLISSSEIPVLPAGQHLVHLVHRFSGRMRTLDLSTGKMERHAERAPAPVIQAIAPVSGESDTFLLTAEGTLHAFNLADRSVGPTLSTYPGTTRLVRDAEGKLYLLNPFRAEIVVLDETGSRWLTSVQLPSRSTWAWIDPEGPFMFAGAYSNGTLTMHVIEKDTLTYRNTHTFPNAIGSEEETTQRLNPENRS